MGNLNAEAVKKALECCIKVGGYRDAQICNDCPLSETRCAILLTENALALITSQEQRIKELAEENEGWTASIKILVNNNADLEFELAQTYDLLEESKADTVSEIRARVAVHFGTYCEKDQVKIADVFRLIDQIAKEMLEGENEN